MIVVGGGSDELAAEGRAPRAVFGASLRALEPSASAPLRGAAGRAGARGAVCYELRSAMLNSAVRTRLMKLGLLVTHGASGGSTPRPLARGAAAQAAHAARTNPAAGKASMTTARLWSAAERSAVRCVDDLNVLRVLGIGSFGRVKLVRPKSNGAITFALKTIQKRLVMQVRQQQKTDLPSPHNLRPPPLLMH